MKKYPKFLAALLATAITVTSFGTVPFAFATASFTTDVTDTTKLSMLSVQSNYDVSLTAAGITPTLAASLASESLLKNHCTDIKLINGQGTNMNFDGNPTTAQMVTTFSDGGIDNGAYNSFKYSYSNFKQSNDGKLNGYVTFTYDKSYIFDDVYLISAWVKNRTIKNYGLYIGDDLGTLYTDDNLVLEFDYNGYTVNHETSTALNNNSNYSEGQVFTFGGTEKPQGKYIGYKIYDSAAATDTPHWLYISEAGAHGTSVYKEAVTDVTDNTKKSLLTLNSLYDVTMTANITPDLASTLAEDNLYKTHGTSFKVLNGNGTQVSYANGTTVADALDGGIDDQTIKSYLYCYDNFTMSDDNTVNGYVTLAYDDVYTFDDIYMISSMREHWALKSYELYVGNTRENLYSKENRVLEFNYDGFVEGGTSLNTNDNYSNGQIYTFTGSKKPQGKYIGYKVLVGASFSVRNDGKRGWLYINEAGAHGTAKNAVKADFPSDKTGVFTTYGDHDDTVLQTTDITQEQVAKLANVAGDTNLLRNHSMIFLTKTTDFSNTLNNINNSVLGSKAKITDGVMDTADSWAAGDSYYYTLNMPGTTPQGYLTISLDGVYDLSKMYIMSSNLPAGALYDYDVYVSSNARTLYTDANKVLSFKYDKYSTAWDDYGTAAMATKLNNGDSGHNSEGQVYTFGTGHMVGKYVGIKINDGSRGMNGWLYISEMGLCGKVVSKNKNTDVTDGTKAAMLDISSQYKYSLKTSTVTPTEVKALHDSANDLHANIKKLHLTSVAGSYDSDPTAAQFNQTVDGLISGYENYDNTNDWYSWTNHWLPTVGNGEASGYLTMSFDKSYLFDKIYLFSHISPRFALSQYEVYASNDETTLYNDENKITDFNCYYPASDSASYKLNNTSTVAEGQIFSFTGDEKPSGKYIGIKIIVSSTTIETNYLGWFHTCELGAVGKSAAMQQVVTDMADDVTLSNTEYESNKAYSFTVSVKNGGTVTSVKANDTVLTAADGRYTVTSAPDDLKITVTTTRDKYSPKKGIWNGKSVYMRSSNYYNPSWNSEMLGDEYVTRDETVMFYTGRTTAKLQFPIDNIVCVNSYNLDSKSFKQYYLGEDFTVNANGEMVLTANTKIPVYSDAAKLKNLTSNYAIDWGFIAGMATTQPKYLITVTYTHTRQWDGTSFTENPDSQLEGLKFKEKAEKGETVNVLFMGDSITTGCNATGQDMYSYGYNNGATITVGSEPTNHIMGWQSYLGLSGDTAPEWTQKAWANLVVENLQSQYPDANFTLTNRGIGSSASEWYYNNINAIVNKNQVAKPDLVFIAFGMNENGRSKESMVANVTLLKNYIREWNPDCTVVFVSAFHPNAYTENAAAVQTGYKLGEHEEGYKALAEQDENAAYAPVFSQFQKLLTVKEGVDYTGNNYNHVNDFGVNIYANTILSVLSPQLHTVSFVNKNGTVIGKVKVSDNEKLSAEVAQRFAEKADDIFGYTKGKDGAYWTQSIADPITADKSFYPIYERKESTYKITVNDGFETETYDSMFDRRMTVNSKYADCIGWRDATSGAVLSDTNSYTFYMPGDISLAAINKTADITTVEKDTVVMNTAVHNVINGTAQTVVTTAYTELPENAVLVEKGFVITNESGYLAANQEITLQTTPVQIAKSVVNSDGAFMMQYAIKNDKVRYIRVYVKYTLNGIQHTEYSAYTARVNS